MKNLFTYIIAIFCLIVGFVGFAIKSHSIKAEYLEFSVGVRL